MRKLIVFNHVSLDGYFVDVNGDMSWAHKNDAEWEAFVAGNAKGGWTAACSAGLPMSSWPAIGRHPLRARMILSWPKG